ncbi:hypothetical protein [Paracoccus sediminicola]|uniref:hypothetical protein n=1 Tax=Paracoccus sediminicola TaxID=3017783 RepID=UPI0022F08F08|nr:hypothetical protein [Paracoccus sediminicola]WBU56727.1 hypothetical protein PAF18_14835 [Paracoccus sediminicola]
MTLATILSAICVAATLPLSIYCHILSRRLKRLNDLESGLGGAIAVMTSEISRLDGAIRRARAEAEQATNALSHAIEDARNEKAYWALQKELTRPAPVTSRRLRPRAAISESADD